MTCWIHTLLTMWLSRQIKTYHFSGNRRGKHWFSSQTFFGWRNFEFSPLTRVSTESYIYQKAKNCNSTQYASVIKQSWNAPLQRLEYETTYAEPEQAESTILNRFARRAVTNMKLVIRLQAKQSKGSTRMTYHGANSWCRHIITNSKNCFTKSIVKFF